MRSLRLFLPVLFALTPLACSSNASPEGASGEATNENDGAAASSGNESGTRSGATSGETSGTSLGSTSGSASGSASGSTSGANTGSSEAAGASEDASAGSPPPNGNDAAASESGDSSKEPEAGTGGADTGSSAASNQCRPKYASGVNVAWFSYANDVPNPDIAKFTSLFTNVYNAGGRVIRWWYHTNGTTTPGYTNGKATPITASGISDIKKILDAAAAAGVAVNISIWSFNMLAGGQNAPIANNLALLTDDTSRQAYITNVLTPLVTALKGHPGLYSWEIFNEPEGMTAPSPAGHGWTTCPSAPSNCAAGGSYVSEAVIQKNVNWFADAIHTADPSALVTNGAWTFITNSNVNGNTNAYSDSALISAGGRAKGTLDYYQIHYYENWGSPGGAESVSPFQWPASHWGLTDGKPIVIGEFWDIDTYVNGTSTTVSAANSYTTLATNGYAGAWAWQYANQDGAGPNSNGVIGYPSGNLQTTWGPQMQSSIQNMYKAHTAEVECH